MNCHTDNIFSVAIVGRANVGKTTIFNRLVGTKRSSIVANIAGVTRDRNEVETDFFGLKVRFIDCAGIELRGKKDVISRQMLEQAMEALRMADLCLFVIDGTFGVIEQDIEVFNILRKQEKKSVLIINKAENPNKIIEDNLTSINCKSKIFLSAEHNLGFGDLFNVIKQEYDFWLETNGSDIVEGNKKEQHETEHKIRIAVLGRPNAGKSTFLNNILQQKRLITSDISGTTRDKIELNFQYTNPNTKNKQDFVLIDTAGIRKKHKNGDNLELASVDKSLEALQFADVVVMIMDITTALEEQDLTLCQRICNEGRILIICFNKWDLTSKTNENNLLEMLKYTIQKSLAQVKGLSFFTCSALNDNNLYSIFDTVNGLYEKWNSNIPSSKFNKVIESCGKLPNCIVNTLKIKYINQIKTRPPTFVAFSGKNEKSITNNQVESLKNWLYREFNLLGIPIRVSVRGKKR